MTVPAVFKFINWITGMPVAIDDAMASALTGPIGTTLSPRVREKLTAVKTYFVRQDGSNSNDGLTNTAAGAFLTIQKAVDVATGTLDLGVFSVNISLNDGTWNELIILRNYISNGGTIIIKSTNGVAANCILNNSTNVSVFSDRNVGVWLFRNVTFTNAVNPCISVGGAGTVIDITTCVFGACASHHLNFGDKSKCITAGHSITGSPYTHLTMLGGANCEWGGAPITLSGTPAWGLCMIYSTLCSSGSFWNMTFPGTGATGQRYQATSNAVIDTNGGGANYFPGNVAGATSTGGQYL